VSAERARLTAEQAKADAVVRAVAEIPDGAPSLRLVEEAS
jgi:hypothetical protein